MTRRLPSFLLLAATAAAQGVCDGNGLGSATLRASYAPLGGTFTASFGSPAAPGGLSVIGIAESAGPIAFPHPLIGNVCLDLFHPSYTSLLFVLDAQGRAQLQTSIPNATALLQYAGFYLHDITVEGPLASPTLSITRTMRVTAELPDSWRVIPGMQIARSLHTATALARTEDDPRIRVLITGGDGGNFMQPVANASSELYDPMRRAFVAGPTMTQPRCGHQATLLADGRVLLCGGTGTGGVVTATAEIYDPVANTFTATAAMGTPRTAHRATRLPDGRVLVTGGLTDWTQATTQFVNRLNTTVATAEIWNPTTGSWTALASPMADRRSGHAQLLLPDGRVLLISGINGGVTTSAGTGFANVPTYTATCELFDPATGTFAATGNVTEPCAFAAASLLGNGQVLLTGGIVADIHNFNAAIATQITQQWNGSTWTQAAPLPTTHAFHGQVVLPGGEVMLAGGMIGDLTLLAGSPEALILRQGAWVATAPLGTHGVLATPVARRGNLTVTLLHDGSVLAVGGADQLVASANALIHYR